MLNHSDNHPYQIIAMAIANKMVLRGRSDSDYDDAVSEAVLRIVRYKDVPKKEKWAQNAYYGLAAKGAINDFMRLKANSIMRGALRVDSVKDGQISIDGRELNATGDLKATTNANNESLEPVAMLDKRESLNNIMIAARQALNSVEYKVFSRFYLQKQMQRTIAKEIGIKRSTCGWIARVCLDKIRKRLNVR